MKTRNKKGFSLVELLVVITIIAILSVVAYMALGGQTAKARNSRRVQDLSTIQSSLEIYFINNNNTYPTALNDLVPTLISKIPTDPSSKGAIIKYYTYNRPSTKTYRLAASLEDDTGGLASKAYVIGNATGSWASGGFTYNATTGVCDTGAPCSLDDGDLDCLPYCL